MTDYRNDAKKETGTHQGLLLTEISHGNVLFPPCFQLKILADDSKLLCNSSIRKRENNCLVLDEIW